MLHLTACNLSTLLTLAKEAHTRWEERFRMEGATPPVHTWENWYARFILARLTEQEMGETFDVGACGLETVAENHVIESPFVSEPSEPEKLCGFVTDRCPKPAWRLRLKLQPKPPEPRDPPDWFELSLGAVIVATVVGGVIYWVLS